MYFRIISTAEAMALVDSTAPLYYRTAGSTSWKVVDGFLHVSLDDLAGGTYEFAVKTVSRTSYYEKLLSNRHTLNIVEKNTCVPFPSSKRCSILTLVRGSYHIGGCKP